MVNYGTNKNNYFVGTARGLLKYGMHKENEITFEKPEEPSKVRTSSFHQNDNMLLAYENGNDSIFDQSFLFAKYFILK